jgi:hypothetical protein
MGVTGAELAKSLNLSPGRISQLVSAGKLKGTFTGEGRARRFDLALVTQALRGNLDPGQMMGNGAQTKRMLDGLSADAALEPTVPRANVLRDGMELPTGDDGRYALARAQKAEEEARRLRRQNAQEEGQFVLASEVERQVSRVLGQELREVETYLRDTARVVADRLGQDFKVVRQILLDEWRKHRAERSKGLVADGDAAAMSEAEQEADI